MFETSILTTHTINLLVISIYAITTCASFVAFSTLCLGSIRHLASNSTSQSLTNWFSVGFFANLAGLPPLPGFFLKLHLLTNVLVFFDLRMVVMLLLINFTVFYFYIQFYKNTYAYTKVKLANTGRRGLMLYIVTLALLSNFYPIYTLLSVLTL